MPKPLPPAFRARAKAVQAAHQHLSTTHPQWHRLSPQDRIRLVHGHVDKGGLARHLTDLRRAGHFTQRGTGR